MCLYLNKISDGLSTYLYSFIDSFIEVWTILYYFIAHSVFGKVGWKVNNITGHDLSWNAQKYYHYKFLYSSKWWQFILKICKLSCEIAI